MKKVYVPMSADLVHGGHINIIQEAEKLGEVIVGLVSDEAIKIKKNRPTIMNYSERLVVIENIKGVSKVLKQDTEDYRPNLLEIKPDYFVHGNDWSEEKKKQVVDTLKEWGGKLIELPYTKGISSTEIRKRIIDGNS